MQAYQNCHSTTKVKQSSMTNKPLKQKRSQVKNACKYVFLLNELWLILFFFNKVNCKKACKKCDDRRPCQRCIKYNLVDTYETGDAKQSTNNTLSSPLLTLSTVPVLPITMETYMPSEQQQELSTAKIGRIMRYHQEQQAYHRNQSKWLIGTFLIVNQDSLSNIFQSYTWNSRGHNKDLDYANSIKNAGTISDSMLVTFH
ncbi:hypothetical protein AB4K20DRAFT_1997289 [Rhizopus microsporus]